MPSARNNVEEVCAAAKAGEIFLFDCPEGSSRIISWLENSPYYHVAIYAGDYRVIEARTAGVKLRDLRSPQGGHSIHRISTPSIDCKTALEWALAREGAKYDPIDVAVILLNRIFARLRIRYKPRSGYSCGEFVACAFEAAGHQILPGIDSANVMPSDFARLLPAGALPAHVA